VIIYNFESGRVDEEQMLKVTVKVRVGRKSVDKWKWTHQPGSVIRGELKSVQTLKAEAYHWF
jgi:hypothetical protein